jgi:hypothetical protein
MADFAGLEQIETKKAPARAGAFEFRRELGTNQYFATTGALLYPKR